MRPLLALLLFALPSLASAQQGLPVLSLDSETGTTYSLSFQLLAFMTALTVLPGLVLGMTAFTRIIIVLSILRQALGTMQTPPNQVLIAIALFLTFFVMQPVLTEVYTSAVAPYLDGAMPPDQAVAVAWEHLSAYMLSNTRQNDLLMFSELSGQGPFASPSEIPVSVLLPAHITSELKTAFQIGFLLFLPFLVIDMVIASILMALGMMMLSPMIVSLPFKLLLFVLVDGWALTMGSLASSFQGVI
ncbi:MAG: flagellar type III secretion system pore protein FliP [Rhodobacteraceae bacterium]|nr:flagellar type III secretion system pore protein FliP [Paracoccaceae bacterium]